MKNENIYEFFGIKKEATKEEIKKAYRCKSKENHPDLGGDRKEFEKCNTYYKLLTNPKSRNIYDKTGKMHNETENKLNFLITITRMFETVLASMSDYKTDNLIEKMRELINKEILGFENQKDLAKKSNRIANEIKKRIKGNSENVFNNILNDKIDTNEIALKELDEKIQNHKEALEFLNNFNYEVDINNVELMYQQIINIGDITVTML